MTELDNQFYKNEINKTLSKINELNFKHQLWIENKETRKKECLATGNKTDLLIDAEKIYLEYCNWALETYLGLNDIIPLVSKGNYDQ